MDDFAARIAAIEALRAVIGDPAAAAAIAALRGEQPSTPALAEKQDAQTITNSPQTSVGGDAADSAIGAGNAVLHHMLLNARQQFLRVVARRLRVGEVVRAKQPREAQCFNFGRQALPARSG